MFSTGALSEGTEENANDARSSLPAGWCLGWRLINALTYALLTSDISSCVECSNGCICCDLCGLLLQQRNAIKRDGLDLPVLIFDRGDHGLYTAAI